MISLFLPVSTLYDSLSLATSSATLTPHSTLFVLGLIFRDRVDLQLLVVLESLGIIGPIRSCRKRVMHSTTFHSLIEIPILLDLTII